MNRAGPALSNLDKVLWPATGFTKGEMIGYYEAVAPVLLPHLEQRPLTLGRFPDGLNGRGFAQIECRGSPDYVETVAIELRNGATRNFCLAHNLESLLWIANLNTIELHVFQGTADALGEPRAVLFDLDPEPPARLSDACRVALLLRDELAEMGLRAFAKTTGGAGLHVIVPLNSPHTYAQTRTFARGVAARLADAHEGIVDSAAQRSMRAGAVLVDWAQNNERRSMIAPYSLRASDVPSASAPVAWEEVERVDAPLRFSPPEVLARVERMGDLFAPVLELVQVL